MISKLIFSIGFILLLLILLFAFRGNILSLFYTGDLEVKLSIFDNYTKYLWIQNDGTFSYDVFNKSIVSFDPAIPNSGGQQIESTRGKLDPKELKELKREILANIFFSLNNRYESNDNVEYILKIKIGEKYKEVYCYSDNCPRRFMNIQKEVIKIASNKIEYYKFA